MKILRDWYQRTTSNPELVVLLLFLLVGLIAVLTIGNLILPVLVALIIAYLLDGVVIALEKRKVPRLPSVLLVYTLFLTIYLLAIFGMIPLLVGQITAIAEEGPLIFDKFATGIEEVIEKLTPEDDPESDANGDGKPPDKDEAASSKPDDGTSETESAETTSVETTKPRSDAAEMTAAFRAKIVSWIGDKVEKLLPNLLAYFAGGMVLLVYAILFPILVFFMLKDKKAIQVWFTALLPKERKLVGEVWRDVDRQMSNYVRGKAWEILIVGGVTFFVFTLLGLNYALLLSLAVGFSVIVPYVGATLVTFPVAMVAFAQWGFDSNFAWVIGSYLVIQAFDGNLLVPLIFSEAVNLHPIAIIFAVLLFGGVWGFWGVVLAIPLATLVQAVRKAWPKREGKGTTESANEESGSG